MVERLPGGLPRIAFVYGDAALALHVREAMTGRAEVAYAASVSEFDVGRLADADVVAALVNIDDRDWLDDIEISLEQAGVPVVFNDPDISRQLDGWDRARWLRHLTAKLCGSADVDPPRPEAAPVAAGEPAAAPDEAPGPASMVAMGDGASADAASMEAVASDGATPEPETNFNPEPTAEVSKPAWLLSTETVAPPTEPAGPDPGDTSSRAGSGVQDSLSPADSPEVAETAVVGAVDVADEVAQSPPSSGDQAGADTSTKASFAGTGEPGSDARDDLAAEAHGVAPTARLDSEPGPLEPGQGAYAARGVAREIRSVILRVTGGRVLVPSTTMAEIITFARPEPLPGAPPWLPGRVAWQGWRVPVVAFSTLAGVAAGEVSEHARVVILKALSGQPGLPYFGMLSEGFPRLTLVSEDVLVPDAEAGTLPPGVREQVRLRDEPAWIPDLPAVEAAIAEALKTAA